MTYNVYMKRIIALFSLSFLAANTLFALDTIKLKASQELYYTDYEEAVITPSANGIFPVRLTVTTGRGRIFPRLL